MSFIDCLVRNPRTFHYLRKFPEWNYRATKRHIQSHLEPTAPTLDLGCGTGEFATLFSPQSYLGVDISACYLAYARKRLPEYRFAQGVGQALPLADGAVKQLLINGVLHHLDGDLARRVLKEAARVLAADGRLLLIEDIQPENPGLLTRTLHAMDHGEHIRPRQGYPELLGDNLRVEKELCYRSGICHYGFWLLRKS